MFTPQLPQPAREAFTPGGVDDRPLGADRQGQHLRPDRRLDPRSRPG